MSVVLTVPPIYMLGRRFGGASVGVAAAAMVLAGHYVLAFTHIGYTHMEALGGAGVYVRSSGEKRPSSVRIARGLSGRSGHEL